MSFFSPKTWKQRIVEFPGRRRLDDTSTADVYDVSRAEGNITQEGDGFTAANMNDLEQRITEGFQNVQNKTDELTQNMSDFEDDLSGKQNKISNQTFKFTPNDAGITTSSIQCFRYGNVCIVTGTFTPNQEGTPLTLGSFNVHPTKAITFPINGYEKVASYGTLSASGVFQCNIPGAMANAPCAINFAFLTA